MSGTCTTCCIVQFGSNRFHTKTSIMSLSEYGLATLRFVYTSKLRRELLGEKLQKQLLYLCLFVCLHVVCVLVVLRFVCSCAIILDVPLCKAAIHDRKFAPKP